MKIDDKYPFLEFINEDKSHYKTAREAGYDDPDNLFLIGNSGGFLMNINPNDKFINTNLFREAALHYQSEHRYISFKQDSIPHRKFRKKEEYRRKHGYSAPCLLKADGSIHNIRITGAHYNFLNYNRIELLDESSVIVGKKNNTGKKKYDFPNFFDSQFWTFHVMEFAERNGFNLIIDKTRRGGFSYMMASDSANTVNVNPRKVVIHVADDSKYLTMTGGLTDFAVNDIKFYEEGTPFVRGILSTVKKDFRLGYKLPNGVEADKSWRSALISVSANNNPNCAIGKDAVKIKVEEVSTMSNFSEFMDVTVPAMTTGAYTTGILIAWGTATAGNMQEFERAFYSPKEYNFMPFENVWDKDMRNEICGFFKPYCWGLQGQINGKNGVDKDGNSDILTSLEIVKKERKEKKETCETIAKYINYLGQYAITPNESFSSSSENIFSSDELTDWANKLLVDNDLHFYIDGMFEEESDKLIFKSNERLRKENKKTYEWIYGVPRRNQEDPHGCIRMWFPPEYIEYKTERGIVREIPEGLYSISYDPVGIDKDKKEITNRHSHNSIRVWMNPHEINGYRQKCVAAYYGRPEKLEEADRICYNLARHYNCIKTTAVEINRGETVSNFRKWSAVRYLANEPLYVWDTSKKGAVSKTYGYSITTANKMDALRLLKEFLYEKIGEDEFGNPIYNFHRIYDYQAILELIKWNPIGNFDRVSEMLLRGIEWKSFDIKGKLELEARVKVDESNEEDFFNREWF